MPRDEDEPKYTVYRSRPRLFGRGKDDGGASPVQGLRELRGDGREARDGQRRPAGRPEYQRHGGRRLPRPPRLRLPGRRTGGAVAGLTVGRVVKWLLLAALGWTALSLLLFLLSAQIQRANTSDAARTALEDSGFTLTSPNTILVLGSDARTEETAEPGSTVGGPSRSDSILLLRVGGGKSARLSIPRDTVVDIPGHGRDKVNAAYAIGGAALTIETLEQYLGVEINHLVEVDFANFPEFIDALGGITVKTGCVKSDINGGRRNGGFSLRLKKGENHINGKQALALARTRRNKCNPSEDDLSRARRQQEIMGAIKSRIVSPATFLRGPWVGWAAPKAIRSDMGGASLLGVFSSIATAGEAKTRVLEPSGATTLPDGGSGLLVDEAEKARAVRALLRG